MSKYYPHIFKPIKVRGITLKNRLVSSNSLPHFLMGPEPYPTTNLIELMANRAKNGAAVVTMAHTYAPIGQKGMKIGGDTDHFAEINMYDPQCQNYLIQMCDAIHYYGGKACLNLTRPNFMEWDIVDNPQRHTKAYTQEIIDQFIDAYVEQAVVAKKLGFDIGSVHFAYRSRFAGAFFSPLTNTRTDEYGGSLENRSKVVLEIFRRIRAAVGEDFVLEGLISVRDLPGGYTFEDTKKFAKMSEGLIDILQLRMEDGDPSHPMGFHEPNPTLRYAQELKELNLKTLIEPIGGFQNPDVIENLLAGNGADLVGMARSFICDDEYGLKLQQGRGEDIVPCVRCNKCHVISHNQPYRSACTVNPSFGISSYLHRKDAPLSPPKKIAVVGGGPAGMESALIAARRGNQVTLFEQSDVLGGQLIAAAKPWFKWPIQNFLDYMIRQVEKSDITVRMNTPVTNAAQLEQQGFDVVIAATGAHPFLPRIPGVAESGAITAVTALLQPEKVRGDVVIIGAGEVGMETGMEFAKKGHAVTVLEMGGKVAPEVNPIHYRDTFDAVWKSLDNLKVSLNSRVIGLEPGAVVFEKDGQETRIAADTIIIAAGTRSNYDAAMDLYGAYEYHMAGDCEKVGNLMSAMRTAYGISSQL